MGRLLAIGDIDKDIVLWDDFLAMGACCAGQKVRQPLVLAAGGAPVVRRWCASGERERRLLAPLFTSRAPRCRCLGS